MKIDNYRSINVSVTCNIDSELIKKFLNNDYSWCIAITAELSRHDSYRLVIQDSERSNYIYRISNPTMEKIGATNPKNQPL